MRYNCEGAKTSSFRITIVISKVYERHKRVVDLCRRLASPTAAATAAPATANGGCSNPSTRRLERAPIAASPSALLTKGAWPRDSASGRAAAFLVGRDWLYSATMPWDGRHIVKRCRTKPLHSGHRRNPLMVMSCKSPMLLNGNIRLDGVTAFPLFFDLRIHATDPPPADLSAELGAPVAPRG
jgi:hypothetical protein